MKPNPQLVFTVANNFAFICVLALLPWALGVPGNGMNSRYSQGWSLGLQVLWLFPSACAVVNLLKSLCLRNESESRKEEVNVQFSRIFLVLLALALVAQAVAWFLILT